jgi:hypothetical protein
MGAHTRSKDLARAVAEAAVISYQQALEMVRVARADGAIPPVRDDRTMAGAVTAVLSTTAVTSPGPRA